MVVLGQSSRRATWPPRAAAVRQLSIADITFSCSRPTWPRWLDAVLILAAGGVWHPGVHRTVFTLTWINPGMTIERSEPRCRKGVLP
jgi:hypothetical protein